MTNRSLLQRPSTYLTVLVILAMAMTIFLGVKWGLEEERQAAANRPPLCTPFKGYSSYYRERGPNLLPTEYRYMACSDGTERLIQIN